MRDEECLCLASRAKKGALEEFSSWAKRLMVEGAGWDTSAAEQELQSDIDRHIERLIASKVYIVLHPFQHSLNRNRSMLHGIETC